MSEYQVIAFRAIDAPVSEENLEYMRRQSSRAEITAWSFDNEYRYGDFRGNAAEMLRRGYDLHVRYANFGIRTVMIRIPAGLPDPVAAKPYLEKGALEFVNDKSGFGGILSISPYFDGRELDEIRNLNELVEQLTPLRAEILAGDLRPLYIAHLAASTDDNHNWEETREGPIPAGLEAPSPAQFAVAEFFGLSKHLLAAAAQNAPPLPPQLDLAKLRIQWLNNQSVATKETWLVQLMGSAGSAARREILAAFQKSAEAPIWPTVRLDRTVSELMAEAEKLEADEKQRGANKATAARAKRLADMAAEPQKTIETAAQLVKERTAAAYEKIAESLSDLREALVATPRSGLAEKQALKLNTENPTLRKLTAALRKKGFVPKS